MGGITIVQMRKRRLKRDSATCPRLPTKQTSETGSSLHHLLQTWKQRGPWLAKADSQNTCRAPAGVLRGKTNTGPHTPARTGDMMWKGHRTQPVDLDQPLFKTAFWHLLLLVDLTPSGLFPPCNYGRHVVPEAEHVQGLPSQPLFHSSWPIWPSLEPGIGNWLRTGPCKQLERDLLLWVCSHSSVRDVFFHLRQLGQDRDS